MEEKVLKKNKYEIDMCSGALLPKIVLFTLPLMLSGILQLLFNAADIVVVGRFAGNEELAAVGSCGSLINLIVNVFIGLSVGANVMVARFYGAGQKKELEEMIHTAIATALVSGVILIFLGIIVARPALTLMATPEDVIEHSVFYMRIYFVGMPVMMLYNFGSAILRAVGDTKRPLYYLLLAGVINVVLNLIFVIYFHMGVAGVAWATVISQVVSALLVLRCLIQYDGELKLNLRKLRIVPDKFLKMVRIGLPAGVQGAFFSISNMLIQSSVNSFGSTVMAGNTAAGNIEGFVYTAMNALHQTAISFSGQNFGAKKYKRIAKVVLICELCVLIIGLVMGNLVYIFGEIFLQLYSVDPEVIRYGMLRMSIICTTYCLCGMMDVMVGALRGIGRSVMPMLVTLTGVCVFRVVWIFTVFAEYRSLEVLYISYPISWAVTILVHTGCFIYVYHKTMMGRDE
ncbi:MAG: MATE family efflux transporter [Lachnospiraceae bacterium]|nr:MATE family efflux transporter [Lachnospiraceae bacterium]